MKVTLDFFRKQVAVEGDGPELLKLFEHVKEFAPKLGLGEIRILTQPELPVGATPPIETVPMSPQGNALPERLTSVRDFAKKLPTTNLADCIAVIAYHVNVIQRKTSFSVSEMEGWFGLCNFQKPKQMSVALSDARRKYEYVTSRGRDQWSISPGGENRVLELEGK